MYAYLSEGEYGQISQEPDGGRHLGLKDRAEKRGEGLKDRVVERD
jgi:hypothetical protein